MASAQRMHRKRHRHRKSDGKHERIANGAVLVIAALIAINVLFASTGRGCYASDAPVAPAATDPDP